LLLMGVRAELAQLRHAVYELGDFLPELILNVGQGEVRVLGDIVQEGGDNRDRIDADVGEDLGSGDGMRDIRLAGHTYLRTMGSLGELKGSAKRLQISLRIAASYGVANVPEARLVTGERDEAEPEPIGERQAH